MRFLSVLAAIPLLMASAIANTQPQAQPTTGFLTRLQRVQDHDDVCVLVARDGNYRFERRLPTETHVYIGMLQTTDLAALERALNEEGLKRITQNNIQHTMGQDSLDLFFMDVYRQGFRQELSFSGSNSRKPFRNVLDPVLDWLAAVSRAGHTEINDSGANHCLPDAIVSPDSPSAFLILLAYNNMRYGHVEVGCLIVYRDGKYRRERKTQRFGFLHDNLKVKVSSGQIGPSDTKHLRSLLDSEPLASLRHEASASRWSKEFETTTLVIPRASGTQHLQFSDDFDVPRFGESDGRSSSGLTSNLDWQEQTIQPVRSWLKKKVERAKLAEVDPAAATDCAPESQRSRP